MITNTKTLLTVKTEKSLKLAAQETAAELGLSLGTLINALLKQFVRTKEIRLSTSYYPNASLRASIAEGEKEFAEGKLSKPLPLDEFLAELNS